MQSSYTDKKIERLQVLLCNALAYLYEASHESSPGYYEKTLGITEAEIRECGATWLLEEPQTDCKD